MLVCAVVVSYFVAALAHADAEAPNPVPARPYIIIAAAVFAAQLLLIAGLLLQRARRQRAEASLRRSEERYRNVIETQTELICRFQPDTTLTFVNDAYCRYWNRSRAELLGTSFLELIPPEAREAVRERIVGLRDGVSSQEHPVLLADGTVGWQHWINRAIVDGEGRVVELQGVGRDITDRKRMEDALIRIQARNTAILRAIPDLMFVIGPDGTYVDYHARGPEELFAPPTQFLGRTIGEVMPPALADRFAEALARVRDTNEAVMIEYSLPMNGDTCWYEARLVPSESGRVLSIVRDITTLRRADARNHDLAGRLIASQEAERQRIARELHDGLSQKIALLSIDIDLLRRPLRGDEATSRLEQLSARAAEIATDVHDLSLDLHPSKLQTLGLVTALQALCRDVGRQHGLDVEFVSEQVPDHVPPDASLCLYRITQEALHNVVRHSGARRASVRLTRDGEELVLQVADQGRGFTAAASEGAGLGLLSMRERAAFLGGSVVIHSAPDLGTRIGVRVPVDPASCETAARPAKTA